MKFVDSFFIAIRSLVANKLRSSLTMLGIIIGVGAVIALMSIGRGAEAGITATFEQMGTNVINVVSKTPGVSTLAAMTSSNLSLTLDDAEAIERLPLVTMVAPVNENYVDIATGEESTVAVVEASTPEFEAVYNYPAESGRFITEQDVKSRASVVVLGSEIAEDLFDTEDPVGQEVKILGRDFTVVGVLETKGGQMMGVSMDSIIVVPITTYQVRLFPRQTIRGEDAVMSLSVQVADSVYNDEVSGEITELLRKRHRIADDEDEDFMIITMEQALGLMQQVTGIFTIVLGAIAGISLLVGGIGIMNIMLVSVTERTREIGVRKAVGARRRDILMQFLIEAATLSAVGGGIGIVGGWAVSYLISQVDTGGVPLNAVVTPDIVVMAISVSVFIGLASGIYPAMRAASLNPIDALHYG
ncbi:MAG: ABC transporter permease [Chloroflexota bacterium]|nr:ABC transporter permease [Chloroflexota bacterium]